MERIASLDVLRGLVMVLMALDHVRDFASPTLFRPEDLAQTSVPLFLTRWVTHFCAPVFVFLAGTGAYLYGASGRSRADLAGYLLKRGLFLLALELAVINPLWMGAAWSSVGYFAFFQVFWAIGWSMIVLSALVWLPLPVIAGIGILLVVGHNAMDRFAIPADPAALSAGQKAWALLHVGGSFLSIAGVNVLGMYPLIPWPGVMACGYAFGAILQLPADRRDRLVFRIGLGMCVAFTAVRAPNLYGDRTAWTSQPRGIAYSLLSFINCEKYPPSLCYLLMTLGPAIAFLPMFGRVRGRAVEWLRVYGRVPLFYYVIHAALIAGVSLLHTKFKCWPVGWELGLSGSFSPGYSPSLPRVYLLWGLLVVALYLPCRWYGEVRARNRSAWWAKYF